MTENTERSCRFCGKKVLNLGQHIANIHPSVLNSIEEGGQSNQISENRPGTSKTLKEIIRDKVETIMDLKILDILTKNPNASVNEIQAMTEPSVSTVESKTAIEQLRDFKEVADMFSRESQSGSDWTDVAIHSLPIVKDLVRGKHNENRKRNADDKGRTKRSIRRITEEDSGDSGQSRSNSREPGGISRLSESTGTRDKSTTGGCKRRTSPTKDSPKG